MSIFARPHGVTKVDEQTVNTVASGTSFELLGKPAQAGEAHGYVHFTSAVQYVDILSFEVAIERHEG